MCEHLKTNDLMTALRISGLQFEAKTGRLFKVVNNVRNIGVKPEIALSAALIGKNLHQMYQMTKSTSFTEAETECYACWTTKPFVRLTRGDLPPASPEERASKAFDEKIHEFLNHPELDTRDTEFAREVWESACEWQRGVM